jgi:hypothetical protein
MTLYVYHLQLESSIQKMNVDPEDTWLAIGACISVALLGICICVSVCRECKKPTIKPSRSDGDLTQLTQVSSE